MIYHVRPLIQRNIVPIRRLHLFHVRVDALVDVSLVVVHEKGILGIIPPILSLYVPTSFLPIICIIIILRFKVVLGMFVPHWMAKESRLNHHHRRIAAEGRYFLQVETSCRSEHALFTGH